MDRRTFIKAITAAGASTFLKPIKNVIASPGYFGLHQFIESHPEAVFIKRTNVSVKTDSDAKKQEGFNFANEIFALQDSPGIPLSYKIAIKPNLTCVIWTGATPGSEDAIGINTDCDFVEGMIEGMKQVGISSDSMYIREGEWLGYSACPNDCPASPYFDMAESTGIHLIDFPTGRTISQVKLTDMEEGTEITWKDCPDGVIFKRIGYVAPFNQPDSWILNISKFKAHDYGVTLCSKNLQGTCVHPYIRFCDPVSEIKKYPAYVFQDFQPDFEEHLEELYLKHLSDGIPRWDRDIKGRGRHSGYNLELWTQRTCDSLSVTNPGLSIIEGIYGRNGNAFMKGPGPDGKAQDFMTNVLIFGKNHFKVDIIGYWLSGHEPGNFGLFHIAKERGLCNVINHKDIPVYLWENGEPQSTTLQSLERYPLVSPYLWQDYYGQNEPYYHLVNEPYSYDEKDSVEINLSAGWNLISIRVQPEYRNIEPVLASILSALNSVWTYDADMQKWLTYSPQNPSTLNNLNEIKPGMGYYFNMKEAATLIIKGESDSSAVGLKQGWNLAGYNNSTAKPINECISSLKIRSVCTYDPVQKKWLQYSPNSPAYLNSLDIMESGKGYWMDAEEECSWLI